MLEWCYCGDWMLAPGVALCDGSGIQEPPDRAVDSGGLLAGSMQLQCLEVNSLGGGSLSCCWGFAPLVGYEQRLTKTPRSCLPGWWSQGDHAEVPGCLGAGRQGGGNPSFCCRGCVPFFGYVSA